LTPTRIAEDHAGTRKKCGIIVVKKNEYSMRDKPMKKEYDFSQGERGKFYHPDLELKLPIYLENDVAEFLQELSERKGTDIEKIVKTGLERISI
jgi:hypothetical protein